MGAVPRYSERDRSPKRGSHDQTSDAHGRIRLSASCAGAGYLASDPAFRPILSDPCSPDYAGKNDRPSETDRECSSRNNQERGNEPKSAAQPKGAGSCHMAWTHGSPTPGQARSSAWQYLRTAPANTATVAIAPIRSGILFLPDNRHSPSRPECSRCYFQYRRGLLPFELRHTHQPQHPADGRLVKSLCDDLLGRLGLFHV
jgi:hypothetical protein